MVGPVGAGKVSPSVFMRLAATSCVKFLGLGCVQPKCELGASGMAFLKTCSTEHSFCRKVARPHRCGSRALRFSWCFKLHSLEALFWKVEVSVKDILYVTAIWDGITEKMGLLFVRADSPGSLEVVKALLGSFKHFLTRLTQSRQRTGVDVQPCACSHAQSKSRRCRKPGVVLSF